jgi:hypothetical protein
MVKKRQYKKTRRYRKKQRRNNKSRKNKTRVRRQKTRQMRGGGTLPFSEVTNIGNYLYQGGKEMLSPFSDTIARTGVEYSDTTKGQFNHNENKFQPNIGADLST